MLLRICIVVLLCCFTLLNAKEKASSGERPTVPTEIYGKGDALPAIVIGNGGAGPTCVLEALSNDFIDSQGLDIRIGWIQTISRFTLENLKEGVIDLSLTYESEPELDAVSQGWASERTLIFNDHFILVGPKDNPANVLPTDALEEAFSKIAQHGKFFSRNDLSGTNQRERMIWQNIGLAPWQDLQDWYVAENLFPPQALSRADKEGLYTITDRGTLLAVSGEVSQLSVYIQEADNLMNRCHALLQATPSPLAMQFLHYLKSERAQQIIATYSGKKNSSTECPLFTPAAQDRFLEAGCLERLGFSRQE